VKAGEPLANDNPRRENLKSWQSGQSGNPGGSSRCARLRRRLHEALDRRGEGIERAFIEAGLTRALKGDYLFWAYIYDRIEGRRPPGRDRDDGDDLAGLLRRLLDGDEGKGDAP
jgi:hypothetical protein